MEGIKLKTNRISHTLIVGQSGSGKSTLLEGIGNYFYEHDYKIIDLYNQDNRIEGAFFSLEAQGSFRKWLEKRKLPVRALPTKILLPMSSNLPNEVPENYHLYTIPLNQLQGAELNILSRGNLSNVQEDIFNSILNKMNNKDTVPDFITLSEKATKAGHIYERGMPIPISDTRSLAGVIRPLNALIRENCVTSANNPYCIDLVKELNDVKTVTVFHQGYLKTEELTMFNVVWLLRRIYDLKTENKIKPKVVVLIREIGDLAPLQPFDKSKSYSKYYIDQIARKARSIQLQIVGDIQSPLNVSDTLRTQVGNLFAFRLTNRKEIGEIIMRFKGDIRIESNIMKHLPFLKAGQCICLTPEETCTVIVRPPPTMHRYEGIDFIKTWQKLGGKMKNIKEQKKEIGSEWDEAVKEYNELRKEKEKRKQQKEQKVEHSKTWEERIIESVRNGSKTAKEIIQKEGIRKDHLSMLLKDMENNSKIKRKRQGRIKIIELC